jgi:hypothetical protein
VHLTFVYKYIIIVFTVLTQSQKEENFMPKSDYSFAEKEEWYKNFYEHRMPLKAIAAEYVKTHQKKIDPRTVMKGIEAVRIGRNAEAVETELIRNAINRHQMDMNDTIAKIRDSVKVPDIISPPLEWAETDEFEELLKLRLTELQSKCDLPIKERLGREYLVKIDLLSQHLRGEPLWRSFSAWSKADYELERARLELQMLFIRLLKNNFRAKSYDTRKPYVIIKNLGPLYYDKLAAMAIGQTYDPIDKRYFGDVPGSQKITYVDQMAGAPDNEPFYADLLYKVWQHLSSSQEEQRLGALYSRLKDISAKVEIQAEELLLSHYIPGKCRACKKYRK